MSIDLSGIVGVSDDYGVVTQIADESGRVLWSAGPPMVTVSLNITNSSYAAGNYCVYVYILGKQYYCGYGGQQTIEVPVGTVITCTARVKEELARIYLNGSQVVGGKGKEGESYTYDYTVSQNVAITTNTTTWDDPYIYITEIPKDYGITTEEVEAMFLAFCEQ